MGFKLIISPLAELDIAKAYTYYAKISFDVLAHLDQEIASAYTTLEENPLFKICYKSVRGLPLENFPYILFFTLDELNKTVEIRSFFNTYQNIEKYR